MQSGAAAGGDHITNPGGTTIGFDGRLQVKPMQRMGSESADRVEPLRNPLNPARS